MTKKEQLKKNRARNPKKLSKPELDEYKVTIDDISNGRCQLCFGVADDYHHPYFGNRGADKDDRYLVAVCRTCHTECHKSKHGTMNGRAKQIAHDNRRVHDGR